MNVWLQIFYRQSIEVHSIINITALNPSRYSHTISKALPVKPDHTLWISLLLKLAIGSEQRYPQVVGFNYNLMFIACTYVQNFNN